MWLAFVAAAPTVFLDIDIYKAFAETTPLFAIVALARARKHYPQDLAFACAESRRLLEVSGT